MSNPAEEDKNKLHPEMSLYTAAQQSDFTLLTSIYTAAKKYETSKQQEFTSNKDASNTTDRRRRTGATRKSDNINNSDDFHFPVYTGVVFRPKKENTTVNRRENTASIIAGNEATETLRYDDDNKKN